MRGLRAALAGASVALLVAGTGAVATASHTTLTSSKTSPGAELIPGSYIVVLKTPVAGAVSGLATTLSATYGGQLAFIYTGVLNGFSVHGLPVTAARLIALDPAVAYVEQNQVVHASSTTQTSAPNGIDRLDQHNLPLDNSYTYGADGTGVHLYALDTGIRFTHDEFKGSNGSSRASLGVDEIGGNGTDCTQDSHGTNTAALAVGNTYGAAKKTSLVVVRVLDCNGSGSTDQVVAGITWVAQHAVHPAVANLSLGASAKNDAEDQALNGLIDSGVTAVVAAGNGADTLGVNGLLFGQPPGVDACSTSPGDVPNAITVAAVDGTDTQADFSNYGPCVDLYAPGVNIVSAGNASDNATSTLSGTSQATPLVSGAAAQYLSLHPAASPAEVASAINGNATNGAVKNASSATPNRIVYTGFLNGGAPTPSPTPQPQPQPTDTASAYPQPLLKQSHNSSGGVTLQTSVDQHFAGKKVTFYFRSGQNGSVRPLGQATVVVTDGVGYAVRSLQLKPGQTVAIYSKIEAVTDITTPYSNDVRFRIG